MKHESSVYVRVSWDLRHAIDDELKASDMMLAEWLRAVIREALAERARKRISKEARKNRAILRA